MLLLDLPTIGYRDALDLQRRVVRAKIRSRGPDVLLLLEHPPTVTLGTRGSLSDLRVSEHELTDRGVSLFRVERGGAATYHGPGQLVCYPIMDLKSRSLRLRDYVFKLEETIIRTLKSFDVDANRDPRAPGVWTGPGEKIGSLGVRITRRVTFHGFSLNVDLVGDPGDLIVTCAMPEVRMVSLSGVLGRSVDMASVREKAVESFAEVFGVTLRSCSPAELTRILGPESERS
jgi:lipoate-protein ligase B